jgi:peptidoglycan/LPS O-acetylase OafA/YrhL
MKSLETTTKVSGRLLSIDALRGIAALGVVLYHAVLQTANAVPTNVLHWPAKAVEFVSSFGYIGVFLFFVISGFCIHLQWARAQAEGDGQIPSFTGFWRRRVRRLYPPYLFALCLFLLMMALTVGIDASRFFIYDLGMHLLMLHNLDPQTCYSINGVFWTLAIEEQLYLCYFLLLFLRRKLGWGPTLLVCAAARLIWFGTAHLLWVKTGFGIPVPEAALSHWFTWALGALAVEAYFGLITLPRWCRNLPLGVLAVIVASAISSYLPVIPKDTWMHNTAWLLMHPLWGFGFFVIVNRVVEWERSRSTAGTANARTMSSFVMAASTLGLFSYSLYLTHELVIMQSWRFVSRLPPMLNTLFVTVPLTIVFAWIFFTWCEQPFLRKAAARKVRKSEDIYPGAVPLAEEA